MSSVVSLGTLERVDIKSAWPREDTHFTQWLAEERNVALLSQTLGIPLYVTHTEKDVGPYRADIVGQTTNEDIVVIENQYGKTDHDHLGKVLTYAADLDARYVVWIAEQFTEQHQNAVDWLNKRSSDALSVFAIQLELWQIGDSMPAPRFHIVEQPNDWARTARAAEKAASSGAISAYAETYTRYWEALLGMLSERKSPVVPQKFRPGSYYQLFQFPRSGSWMAACASLRDRLAWAEIVFASEAAVRDFHEMHERAEEVRDLVRGDVRWNYDEDRKQQKIIWPVEADPNDEDDWLRQHQELIDGLARLHRLSQFDI